jgi:hypothetical protein
VGFTAPLFYVALVPAVAVFYWFSGRWRAIYLLALSYAFYALSSRIYLVLLIVASAAVYALGLAIAKSSSERAKQAYMGAGVAAVIAVIVAFKAAGAWRGLLLPLGVSYYSFKLISYLIEVYWDDEAVERDPVVFFLFPAFFPQIVSGPIQRPEPFFTQMRDIMARRIDGDQVETGFRFILGGLMLKLLVGDRLAGFIDIVDKSHGDYSYWVMLTTVACYTLQLYADFAGYTNIALGVGKLSPKLQRPIRRGQHPGDVAPLAYEPDQLGYGLSVHPAVDVDAGSRPSRTRALRHDEHGHHWPVAWPYIQFSRLRPDAWRFRFRDGAHRDEPKTSRAHGRRKTEVKHGLANGAGRHDPDLCAHEFLANLLAFADLGSGNIDPQAGLGRRAKRTDGLVGHAAQRLRPCLDLYGDCALRRRGRARSSQPRSIGRQGGAALAAVRHLPVPPLRFDDQGKRTVRLWAVLTQ